MISYMLCPLLNYDEDEKTNFDFSPSSQCIKYYVVLVPHHM